MRQEVVNQCVKEIEEQGLMSILIDPQINQCAALVHVQMTLESAGLKKEAKEAHDKSCDILEVLYNRYDHLPEYRENIKSCIKVAVELIRSGKQE